MSSISQGVFMQKVLVSLGVCIALGIHLNAQSPQEAKPSFDCARAKSKVEKMICSDPGGELQRLDSDMNEAFNIIMGKYDLAFMDDETKEQIKPYLKTLRDSQIAWLKARNECNKDKNIKSCLKQSYIKRIQSFFAGYDSKDGIIINQYCDTFDDSRYSPQFPPIVLYNKNFDKILTSFGVETREENEKFKANNKEFFEKKYFEYSFDTMLDLVFENPQMYDYIENLRQKLINAKNTKIPNPKNKYLIFNYMESQRIPSVCVGAVVESYDDYEPFCVFVKRSAFETPQREPLITPQNIKGILENKREFDDFLEIPSELNLALDTKVFAKNGKFSTLFDSHNPTNDRSNIRNEPFIHTQIDPFYVRVYVRNHEGKTQLNCRVPTILLSKIDIKDYGKADDMIFPYITNNKDVKENDNIKKYFGQFKRG